MAEKYLITIGNIWERSPLKLENRNINHLKPKNRRK